VQTKLNPFSVAAMDQVNAITDTAHQASRYPPQRWYRLA